MCDSGKRKLFLDLDDTFFDTENYLRKVLGGKWLYHEGLIYEAYENMEFNELFKCLEAFMDYRRVPLKAGAREGLEEIKNIYDVIFCSSYHLEPEKKAKEDIAKVLGIPILLCGGDKWDKSHIDMSGGVFVDDNTRLLKLSNAKDKVCFYKKYNFKGKFDGCIVFDWEELVGVLVGLENE